MSSRQSYVYAWALIYFWDMLKQCNAIFKYISVGDCLLTWLVFILERKEFPATSIYIYWQLMLPVTHKVCGLLPARTPSRRHSRASSGCTWTWSAPSTCPCLAALPPSTRCSLTRTGPRAGRWRRRNTSPHSTCPRTPPRWCTSAGKHQQGVGMVPWWLALGGMLHVDYVYGTGRWQC